MTEDGKKIIEIQTENFKCEAKKVGVAKIGTEEIPVYDCRIIPKTLLIFGYDEDEVNPDDYDYGDYFEDEEYEQESLDIVKKLLDEIEKDIPLFLVFISSDINRCAWGIDYWDCENPVKGFIHVWGEYGYDWFTWVESPTVAAKREKDTVFQITFEKWALAKFLQLVFGSKVLPVSLPRYGSEMSGIGNGYISVGKLNLEHRWSKVAGWVTGLPDEYAIDLLPHKSLTEEKLEQLFNDLTKD